MDQVTRFFQTKLLKYLNLDPRSGAGATVDAGNAGNL